MRREYFYRDTDSGTRRLVGPFGTEDEAKKAARYRGIPAVEVLVKNGTSYDPINLAPRPGAGAAAGKTA